MSVALDNSSLKVVFQGIQDISVENPSPFKILSDQDNTSPINTHVSIDVQPRGNKEEKRFEVLVSTKVTLTRDDEPLFVLELQYVGYFLIDNVEDDVIPLILFVQCPTLLWPSIRFLVSQMTQESGLHPLVLQPVDFMELLRKKMESEASEENAQQ
jgi:preprotein translocase subunit SecB